MEVSLLEMLDARERRAAGSGSCWGSLGRRLSALP